MARKTENLLTRDNTFEGYWFLPNKPKQQIFGRLDVSPGKPGKLSLFGTFDQLDTSQNREFILGISARGADITLVQCSPVNYKFSTRGFQQITYRTSVILVGKHFTSESELAFDRIYFEYANLAEWLQISGFSPLSVERTGTIGVTYSLPDRITLLSNDHLEVAVSFSVSGPQWSVLQKSALVTQSASICLTQKTDRSLSSYLQASRDLLFFFQLAFHGKSAAIDICGYLQEFLEDGTTPYSRKIQVYLAADKPNHEPIDSDSMTFRYDDIKDRAGEILDNWMSLSEVMRRAIAVLFESFYSKDLYLENRLIAVTQVAEAFHRQFFGGSYQNQEDYENGIYKVLVGIIPGDMPADWKHSLKGRLKYANEFSLRRRIRELIHHCPSELILSMLGSEKQVNVYIDNLVNLRNLLTHNAADASRYVKNTVEIHWITHALKRIIEILLLQRLGFSDEQIVDLVRRNRLWEFDIRQIRENAVCPL